MYHAVVASDGMVTLVQPYGLTTYCQVDLAGFLNDKQECVIKFGSWMYHKEMVAKKEDLNLKKETFTRLQLDSLKHIDPIKDVFDLDDTYMWFLLGGAERPTLREDMHRREHLAQPFT